MRIFEICSTLPGVPEGDQPPQDLVDANIRILDQIFLSRLSADTPPLPFGDFAYFDTAMICGSTRLEAKEVLLDGILECHLVSRRKSALGN